MHACVLIPAYDNPLTLEGVVRESLRLHPHVLVVDDGSGEETRRILRGIEGITVITHKRNLGKGAALRTGFRAARQMGFTHAVALDADGQHLPGNIPRMLEASRRRPGALVLGVRNLKEAGAGGGSRLGRLNSNFWTLVATGLRLADTQSGLRSYPLAAIDLLHLRTTGYDFEIEVLVKAAWTGIEVAEEPVEVRYFQGSERVSHFRPLADFARVGHLFTLFTLLRICLPAPYLAMRSLRSHHEKRWWARLRESAAELFVREPGSPRRIAASVSLGLFMGLAPVWGFQVALTLLAAHWLGLSKPISVVASHISFPLAIPFILYASLVLGRIALGLSPEAGSPATLELAPEDLPAWIAGSFLLAAIVSAAGGALTLAILSLRRGRRRNGADERAGRAEEEPR